VDQNVALFRQAAAKSVCTSESATTAWPLRSTP
jgi:hypothetical protein